VTPPHCLLFACSACNFNKGMAHRSPTNTRRQAFMIGGWKG
jgi:hypothetical protein